jgi:hypothetical protein
LLIWWKSVTLLRLIKVEISIELLTIISYSFLYIRGMKLLIYLLLIPCLSFAQSKGDTKVIVTATDTANLFNRVAMVLYEKGYSLAQKDESLQYMATNEKATKYANVKINVLVKGNEVTLYGDMDATFTIIVDYEPIVFRGVNGSLYKRVFAELQSIAEKIGGEIRYGK